MKFKNNIVKYTEAMLLTGLWLIVFAAPLFMFQNNEAFEWAKMISAWKSVIPFFLIFLLNHFILVPYVLFRNKRLGYIISAVIIIILFSFTMNFLDNAGPRRPRQPDEMVLKPGPPLDPLNPDTRPNRMPPPGKKANPFPYPPFINSIIIAILILGFDTGIKMITRWSKLEQEQTLLEKENVQNQLAFLRNQVSPHFFMNTLNNIHVLIDINTEEAKEAVIKLSKLMRHLLYDSESDLVPLEKEVEFIVSYINLMKLRFSEKVDITLQIPDEIPQRKIPPLLFTSFVENAFKHGVSYQEHSFIDVSFDLDNTNLHFNVKNSIHKENAMDEASGIGIENSIKRLDLIFPGSYNLDINENDNVYQLKLTIPI